MSGLDARGRPTNAPSSRDAWIGFVGAIVGAVVAGAMALVPWYYEEEDPTVRLRGDIEAGMRGLDRIEDPEVRVRQLRELNLLISLDHVSHWARLVEERLALAEQEMDPIVALKTGDAPPDDEPVIAGGPIRPVDTSVLSENVRRQAIIDAQRALDAEKVCQDENCTSWILR